MLHCQPSLAKPGIRMGNSSNDWVQSGRRESGAPEVPHCQEDAPKASPGRHPRTPHLAPKLPSLTLLPGRESPRIPPVAPSIGDRGYYGGDTVGIREDERGSGDGPEGGRLALANR